MTEKLYELRWIYRDRSGFVWHQEPGQLTLREALLQVRKLARKGIDVAVFEAGTSQMCSLSTEQRKDGDEP